MALIPDTYAFVKESNKNVTLNGYKNGDLVEIYSLTPVKDIRISQSYPESIIIPVNSIGNHVDNKFVAIPWERIDFLASSPVVSPIPTTIFEAVQALGESFFFDLGGNGGGCPEGTNYIYVCAKGTPNENAAELQNAYDTAKTMSASATNRITIVASPGYYDFNDSSFLMDTEFIDLVSLDGNRSVIFNSPDPNGTISITANDVFVKGIDVEAKNFTIDNSLNLLRVENCAGGEGSFGGGGTASGNFTNCVGGESSFGGDGGDASGIFTDCQGGNNSFGGRGGKADGTFTDCQGGDYSFGGRGGTADGTFTGCQGDIGSFGGDGTASGNFTNCVGSDYSFGGIGTASGVFTNCQAGAWSFGGSPTSGTASGVFNYCIADDSSFGGVLSGSLTGKLYYCRLTSGTFLTVSGSGRTIYCIDGNNTPNNQ